MLTDYYRKIVAICLVLVTLIIGLSFILYNQGPRVRLVTLSDDTSRVSLTKGSTITITFDRPLAQKDYADQISVEPDLKFTATTSVQSITLALDENFTHNTDYKVTISSDIYDKSGKKMQEIHEHSFSTAAPSYAYIERNYGVDHGATSFSDTDADDHIVLSRLGSDPEVMFSHPEIRSFAANREYLVVAVKEEGKDSLYTIDLDTRETRQEQLTFDGRIHNLALSPRGQTVLMSAQPDFKAVSPEYYERFANRAESINLETGEVTALTNGAGEHIKAVDILLDSDGQAALIQDEMLAFFAISPFNDYEPSLIGSYNESFGFRDSAGEIVFRDRDNLVLYDIATANTSLLDLDDSGYIRDLSTSNREIVVSTTNFFGGSSNSKIFKYKNWESEPEVAWSSSSDDQSSMNGFVASYDGNLLAIQQNPGSCRFDNIGTNSQCLGTRTVIFDTSTQEVIESFDGFDLVWIP